MIGDTLHLIADQLNTFFKFRFNTDEDKVVLDSIVSVDGQVEARNLDKVVLTLVNLQQEKLTRNYHSYKAHDGNKFSKKKPAVTLNLYIVVSCLYSEHNYQQALTFLSAVVQFFQNKYAFTHANTPALNHDIGKLIFEIENFSPQEIGHLWGIIGNKYVPSVVYKVSVFNYTGGDIEQIIPGTTQPETNNQAAGG
ncbi:DUF4255 domain-containing protein [Gracilimonas mengyeensis]|uniref:Pvc16 N-terminal domain-containing protein n=1 Tax=Gracilimonas mengyeensis TaxID=1302730 RepID=A0A521BN51_9BACT|nr:DUF4255 domain-containing protein [Gracilimonas mengyeensis]SMO48578.1 Protein of unknown function [Gracilimonas mengyeensis]